MTLRAMGIGAGDEVITTAYTYTATCSVICHVGATPVLIDTIPGTYIMDPKKVEAAVTERTKAVICVILPESCIRITRKFSPLQKRRKRCSIQPVNVRKKWDGSW